MTTERLAAVALPLAPSLALVLVTVLARDNRELRKKLADLAAGGHARAALRAVLGTAL